jgi:Flp pilus assembly protein TadB
LAEDLGTWPPEQATVLVEVLQQAGITPQARRTREGVEVTVEDDDSDQAHATLVANMDRIARAARPAQPQGGRRRPRGAARQGSGERQGQGDSSLASQRMSRFTRPVAILVAALLLAAIVPLHPLMRVLILAGAVLAIVWFLGREDEDGEGG